VAEKFIGKTQRIGRVCREPADASGTRSGEPAVQDRAQRRPVDGKERTPPRGAPLRLPISDLDRLWGSPVHRDVESPARTIATCFDGSRDVEETQHGPAHEHPQSVLHPLRPVPGQVRIDKRAIDRIARFHFERDLGHLVALGANEREESAARGLVICHEVRDF